MGKLFGGKPKTPQSVLDAERRAAEAEKQARLAEAQQRTDEDERRRKQRGKASTILSTNEEEKGRTLLGG